jgi:hypothetical protein
MKILIMTVCVIFLNTLTAAAQTYRWTDAQGGMHFTDRLESVPAKYRHKVATEADITTRDPKIRDEVRQEEERARQEEASRPRIATTPDYVPPPPPVQLTPAIPASDELPPGRTKSQRIRDNIERRTAD